MMERRIRERLEGAETYFKTVAAVLLSLLSIYLAYTANRIAAKQAQVAERELQIQEREFLPQLEAWQWIDDDGICHVFVSNSQGEAKRFSTAMADAFLLAGRFSYTSAYERLALPLIFGYGARLYPQIDTSALGPGAAYRYNVSEREGEQLLAEYEFGKQFIDLVMQVQGVPDLHVTLTQAFFVEVSYEDCLGEVHYEILYAPDTRSPGDPYVIEGQTAREFIVSDEHDVETIIVSPLTATRITGVEFPAERRWGPYFYLDELTADIIRLITNHYWTEQDA